MSDALYNCPKCGGRNFTLRGLKTHNCAKRQQEPASYNCGLSAAATRPRRRRVVNKIEEAA